MEMQDPTYQNRLPAVCRQDFCNAGSDYFIFGTTKSQHKDVSYHSWLIYEVADGLSLPVTECIETGRLFGDQGACYYCGRCDHGY